MFNKKIDDLFSDPFSTDVEDISVLDMLLSGLKVVGVDHEIGETKRPNDTVGINLYFENANKEYVRLSLWPFEGDNGKLVINVSLESPGWS